MANMGVSSMKLIDSDGDPLDDGEGKLNVNATLVAGTSIDIGDVDIHLSGNVPLLGNAGAVAAGVLRVTLASDDPAVVSLDEIESAIENIEGAIGADGATGPGKCMSIGGTVAIGGAMQEIAVDSSGHLQVDVLTAPSTAVTNAGTFAVQTDATVHPAGNGTFNSYAQFTAATTPTALTDATNGVDSTETAAKEVIIQADFDNSGYIMVGDSGAAADTNGIRLNAGDTIILPVANIANIYIDASTGSQTVNVTVIK